MRKLQRAAVSAAVGVAAVTMTGCGLGTTKVVVVTAPPAATVAPTAAKPLAAAATAPATAARAARSRPAPVPTTTSRPVATYTDPVTVVQKFYTDLNLRNVEAAYSIGGYNTFGGNDYQRWAAGYADTTGVIGHASDAGKGGGRHVADMHLVSTR